MDDNEMNVDPDFSPQSPSQWIANARRSRYSSDTDHIKWVPSQPQNQALNLLLAKAAQPIQIPSRDYKYSSDERSPSAVSSQSSSASTSDTRTTASLRPRPSLSRHSFSVSSTSSIKSANSFVPNDDGFKKLVQGVSQQVNKHERQKKEYYELKRQKLVANTKGKHQGLEKGSSRPQAHPDLADMYSGICHPTKKVQYDDNAGSSVSQDEAGQNIVLHRRADRVFPPGPSKPSNVSNSSRSSTRSRLSDDESHMPPPPVAHMLASSMSHRAAPPSAPPPPSFLPKHVTPPEIPHMMSSATAVSNPASNTGPSLSSTPRASQLSTGPKPLGMIRPHYSSQAKQKAFKSPLPRTMIPQQTTTSHFSNPSCRASSPRLRSSSIQSKAATARHITSTSAVNIRPPVAASKAREESSERRSSSPPPEADSSYGPFDIDPDALEETMRQYD